MLSVLDSEAGAEGSDSAFFTRICDIHRSHRCFSLPISPNPLTFAIRHYAGDVVYDARGFVDKNKDTLFNDVSHALCASTQGFLAELFEDRRPEMERKRRPPTMATMFKKSVTALVESLTACNPHYIRTIKPNENKRPGEFDMERCTHQVRYLGLLENIRIRRAGYCYRVPMEKFLGRFKMLCPDTWPRASGAADVEKLLTYKQGVCIDVKGVRDYFVRGFDSGLGAYEIGKTKVFIRQPKALFWRRKLVLRTVGKAARGWLSLRLRPRDLNIKNWTTCVLRESAGGT